MIPDMDRKGNSSFPPSPAKIQEDIIKWVLEHGKEIPSAEWKSDKTTVTNIRYEAIDKLFRL
ncbi:MAG: hypothetical protein ABRQ39_27320 [Candidatus Eremiobacterota bacterium]